MTPKDIAAKLHLDIRHEMDPADVSRIRVLFAIATGADGYRPFSDHLYLDLVNGGTDGFTGILVTEAGSSQLIAYAQVSRGNDDFVLELVVHPDHRDEMATIETELLDAALDVIGSTGGGTVRWWVREPTTTHLALAAAAGMGETHRLHQMRRPLPTGETVTIETRAFVPGEDDEKWLTVNNRAFVSHRDQGGWTQATLSGRQRERWFDPAGFLLHERDGQLAGFCWTKVHPATGPDPALGEIYVIAVDPDFQGLGLGKQLVLAGLESLSDRGLTTGMLYVEAGNQVALTLYETLGFTIHSTSGGFQAAVPPASR